MKPVMQTIFDSENGNCFSACLASILELPLESVPNFHAMYDNGYMSHVVPWLADRGYSLIVIRATNVNGPPVMIGTQGMYLIAGYSFSSIVVQRKHAVVCKVDSSNPFGISIVHDPATGVNEPIDDCANPGPTFVLIIAPTPVSKYSTWVKHLREIKISKEYKGHPDLIADVKQDVRPFKWKAKTISWNSKANVTPLKGLLLFRDKINEI